MKHTHRPATFAGTVVCVLGLAAGESFAQADYIEHGGGKIQALSTCKAEGCNGLLFAEANLDQSVSTVSSKCD